MGEDNGVERFGIRFNFTVKPVRIAPVSSVQYIQHLEESPGRNRLCDRVMPKPILGRFWVHLECTMNYVSVVAILHIGGNGP